MIKKFVDTEELVATFDGLEIDVASDSVSLIVQKNADVFVNSIKTTLQFFISRSSGAVELRDLIVSMPEHNIADADELSKALTEQYVKLVEDAGVTFEFDQTENALTSNGTLTSLVIQIITDATDGFLQDSLASRKPASPSKQDRDAASSSFPPLSSSPPARSTANNSNEKAGVSSSTSSGTNTTTTTTISLRIRFCKIDHQNDKARYDSFIKEEANSLHSCLGVLLMNDPISPRVLLAIISLLPFSASTSSVETSARHVDEGAVLLRTLRTQMVDVDSHGRKCRERCMKDLGHFELELNKAIADSYLSIWEEAKRFRSVTPSTREEGVQMLQGLFMNPFLEAEMKQKQQCGHRTLPTQDDMPRWLKTAKEIILDKDLFKHV